MPFQPGQSGNPAGRPVGSRNKVNLAIDEAFEAEGVELMRRFIELAKGANPVAMRMCMDRMLPAIKHRPVPVILPPIDTPDYTRAAITVVFEKVGEGEITIPEANGLLGLVERATRLLASKAAAAIDRADRLARGEEAATLPGEGKPIANNNADTMPSAAAERAPVPAAGGPAVVDITANLGSTAHLPMAAAENGPAKRPRINGGVIARLMSSTSALAYGAAAVPGKTVAARATG